MDEFESEIKKIVKVIPVEYKKVLAAIEPGKPSTLEGAQSTQGKCASSAMIHLKRRRNLNEFCGAYGHNFTFEEMQWLANWLLIRGCNLLVPHAFYYSIRGPRIDERPPDVGPNSPWWSQYKPFARATSRLCWLNTDGVHVCELALLGRNDNLPWRAARTMYSKEPTPPSTPSPRPNVSSAGTRRWSQPSLSTQSTG
jgi:hypothetical protein